MYVTHSRITLCFLHLVRSHIHSLVTCVPLQCTQKIVCNLSLSRFSFMSCLLIFYLPEFCHHFSPSFLSCVLAMTCLLSDRDLKEQFHLMGLCLAACLLAGSIFMVVSDMEGVRMERHACTAIGTILHFSYLGAGAWIAMIGHASFKCVTSGKSCCVR